tara:strand:- start:4855 stop:4962 length:108 start_codon:yes stop_codon:yes gene_type:complete
MKVSLLLAAALIASGAFFADFDGTLEKTKTGVAMA